MLFKNAREFRQRLLTWYRRNARDLPWRRTRDPYKIWVSEIMLQQTQVATVLPYYKKWMKRFPTLQSLAKAPLSAVLHQWAGLGYYRRARMFHEAAKIVLKKSSGKIPETPEELLKLPGIGRYTAGAIASIAFGKKAPVLDGNVKRVLARLLALADPVDTPAGEKILWEAAETLICHCEEPKATKQSQRLLRSARNDIGDFNQALMELGATVCTPENPDCKICPVLKFCAGYKTGRPIDFPVKGRKEISEKIRRVALILRKNGKVLIQRQPRDGRWGGLWIFPFWKNLKSMRQEIPSDSDFRRRLTVQHGFTKYRIRLDVYEHDLGARDQGPGSRKKGNLDPGYWTLDPNHRWVKISKLPQFPFPSPHQKIVKDLVENG